MSATTDPKTLGVVNPATGRQFTEVPVCTPGELDAAFAAAAAAFPAWAADEDERRRLLRQLAVAIPAAGDELVELLVSESGKPAKLAATEVRAAETWLNWLADVDIPRELIADDAVARIEIARRPIGVVAAIVPWNFPISMMTVKLAPALRAGNTVVAKPSPFTPLSALRVGEIMREVLPEGVFQVVVGDDDLGAAMTQHPVPRKVTFTGSIASGKAVAAAAGADLKRATLELGGNDAAILLDDIDVAAIVPAVATRAFFNTGQTCAIPKRIFAPARIFDEVVDAFAAAADATKLGTGPDADMGPLSTLPQYERIQELTAEALGDGATAVTGGGPLDGDGYWFAPTIVTNARSGQRLVDEEQFGPVLPILPYESVDEALRIANDTMFGLCGSVWGADVERAREVAARLECGVAYVNAHGVHRPNMPMGGAKWSGLGAEHGMAGLLEFTDRQVLFQAPGPINTALA
jgi:acyl-CoA reductase-like NAD-dependent aldehyde dehydrogenase